MLSTHPEAVAQGPWPGQLQPTTTVLAPDQPPGAGTPTAIPPVSLLLGVPVDVLTMVDALDRITELVSSGRSTGRSHQVVTVNVDFLINASHSPSLRWILRRSQLAIADGMPLVWASRLLGAQLPERVAGADLIPLLAERSAQHGFSMLLFGGAPGVADTAAGALRHRHPSLRISTVAAPFFDHPEDMDPEPLAAIRAQRPDIVCVALGHPKQDRWIATYGPALGVPVMIGVGGSLDFLAGATKRAPRWMQGIGLEWLHRLVHEPRRLASRYGRDLVHFGPRVVAQRLARPGPGAVTQAGDGTGEAASATVTVIRSDGATTAMDVTSREFVEAAEAGLHAVIDLEQLGPPTWERVLFVVAVARLLQRHGGDLLALESPTSELWWAWRRHLDGLVTVAPAVHTAKAVATAGEPALGRVARRTIGAAADGSRTPSRNER